METQNSHREHMHKKIDKMKVMFLLNSLLFKFNNYKVC